jgi:hypothetical protein
MAVIPKGVKSQIYGTDQINGKVKIQFRREYYWISKDAVELVNPPVVEEPPAKKTTPKKTTPKKTTAGKSSKSSKGSGKAKLEETPEPDKEPPENTDTGEGSSANSG